MTTPHSAKELHVAPIAADDANRFVRKHHYSGKVAPNSQLHLGVFLNHRLEGAMQFGPSLDKRKLQPLVAGTLWNNFIELNRLVFTDRLPRNSESRALAIAFRMMRREYPQIHWVVSFADGTQCGDGTIYRAAGFVLTGIRRNTSIWRAPTGEVSVNLALREATITKSAATHGARCLVNNGSASMRRFEAAGYRPLEGYQLRYVYFLDPTARARLTVPVLPFSTIAEVGAGMYLGKARGKQAMTGHHPVQRRGSTDRHAPGELAT